MATGGATAVAAEVAAARGAAAEVADSAATVAAEVMSSCVFIVHSLFYILVLITFFFLSISIFL